MDSLPRGNQLEVLEVSRDKISVGKLGFMKGSFFMEYLVGGFGTCFYLSIQLGMSSSQLTKSYFSEG